MTDETNLELSKSYYTVQDFLEDKNAVDPDNIVMDFKYDDVKIDFYKPGFDMAFILADKMLYKEVVKLQMLFQSSFGLITHCIFCNNLEKLPYLVRDLKLKDVQYAIFIDLESEKNDEYNLYILHPYIEVQKYLCKADLLSIIKNDLDVKKDSIKNRLIKSSPHHESIQNEGFVPLSDNMRYYLCLLYDGRMLTFEELNDVKNYLLVRRKALENNNVNGIRISRPLEPIRQTPNKHYVYEPIAQQNNEISEEAIYERPQLPPPVVLPPPPQSPPMPINDNHYSVNLNSNLLPSTNNPQISSGVYFNPSVCPPVFTPIQNSIPTADKVMIPNQFPFPQYPQPIPNNQPPPPPFTQSISSKQSNTMPHKESISSKQSNTMPHKESSSRKPSSNSSSSTADLSSKNQTGKFSVDLKKISKNASESQLNSTKTTEEKSTTGSQKSSKSKISFTINKSKDVDAPHIMSKSMTSASTIATSNAERNDVIDAVKSNYLNKVNDAKEKPLSPIDYLCSPVSPTKTQQVAESNEHNNISPSKDISSNVTTSEPKEQNNKRKVSSSEDEKTTSKPIEEPQSKVSKPAICTIELSDNEMDFDEDLDYLNITSFKLMNLFKLILEVSQYGLPENNILSELLEVANVKLQSRISDPNQRNITVTYQNCANQGFIEICSNIHELCNDLTPNFGLFNDLDFAWSQLFPQNIDNKNLLVLFYRFIKLLIPFKVFNQFEDTMKIISDIINKLTTVLDYDFDFDVTKKAKSELNCLPKLFGLYYTQSNTFHTMTDFSNIELTQDSTNKKLDPTVLSCKIKFQIYPVFEFFIKTINSLNTQMSQDLLIVAYNSFRTLRFCLRKLCPLLVSSAITCQLVFDKDLSNIESVINALLSEIEKLMNEIRRFRPIIFSEKHYEFLNCILDCCVTIENQISMSSSNNQKYHVPWLLTNKSDSIIKFEIADFINDFIHCKNDIKLMRHPDTEVSVLRRCIRQHWKGLMYRALRSLASSEPDGSRIVAEYKYLLPCPWQLFTYEEAVTDAARGHLNEWSRLARVDTKNSIHMFHQSRYAGLLWFEKHKLPLKKLLEEISKRHQSIDQLFYELLSN